MSFQLTRPPGDTLQVLLAFIHQQEGASNALLQVVAGTQDGVPFNLTEFQFTTENLPAVSFTPVTQPIDTSDQQDAMCAQIEAGGKTLLFFAPIFDQSSAPAFDPNLAPMIAVCRDGPVAAITPVGGVSVNVPAPNAPEGVAEKEEFTTKPSKGAVSVNVPAPNAPEGVAEKKEFTTKPSKGAFRGNSSETSGLHGETTIFVDGTEIITATERLAAVRGKNLGPKDAQQVRTSKNKVTVIKQAGYCWQDRTLSDVVLVEDFAGFAAGTPFRTGKSTQFGKFDNIDEGTGSELLKVVQTNSDVFGCSLKKSILVASFGTPLGNKPALLRAQVEIFNKATGRFARVPIVDVGPAERLEAVIDLTFALDKFLGTDGSAKVQFRIVV